MEVPDASHTTDPSPLPDSFLLTSTPPLDQQKGGASAQPTSIRETSSTFESTGNDVPMTPDVLLQVEEHGTLKAVEKAGQTLLQAEKQQIMTITAEAKQLLTEAEEHMAVKKAVEDATSLGEFWLKFVNDWSFNFASGLAYHLLMAMFPIVITVAATIGMIEGGLSPNAQRELISYMGSIFPSVLGQNVLSPALILLRKDAGVLGMIALVLALYSGSRLFSSMEDCFAIIYHTTTRSFWKQNLMALVLLLIFIVLIPVMLLTSSIGLGSFVSGVLASLILFQAIYMIVPNQPISWRKSWRGTLVATAALQIYIALFPLYIRHFLGSYTGNTGFAIILLLFFFYFALILLIGAEVNAFYSEGVRAKPRNIAEMVHLATLATDKAELLTLARQRANKQTTNK